VKGEGIEARVASRILARLLSEGKIPWDQGLCILVEDVMRRVGTSQPLGQPGPEILSALKTLLESRDSRGGISIQQTLATAFSSISSRLNACFVFGSVARNEQSVDSDIDVMLIGDVTMDLVTPLLKNAERILGKQINPTIYSAQRFRDKLREGNHFLTTVLREPKIPISVAGALLSEKEMTDEPGTMAPERLVGK
jgi:predicted nucleotidyltransferase